MKTHRKELGVYAALATLTLVVLATASCSETREDTGQKDRSAVPGAATGTTLEAAELGETRNVHAIGKNLLCGQPTEAEFAIAKERGIQVVVNLRTDGEIDWDEAAVVEQLGLEYEHIPFRAPETLTDEVFDNVRDVMRQADEKPVMIHCGSANRVGAVWLTHRVLDEDVPLEQATEEAKEVGLRDDDYLKKAIDYIERNEKRPGPVSDKTK